MIAVIFEVWPRADHRNDYSDLAAELRPLLAEVDGFIRVQAPRDSRSRHEQF